MVAKGGGSSEPSLGLAVGGSSSVGLLEGAGGKGIGGDEVRRGVPVFATRSKLAHHISLHHRVISCK